jgi:hypothetical protein
MKFIRYGKRALEIAKSIRDLSFWNIVYKGDIVTVNAKSRSGIIEYTLIFDLNEFAEFERLFIDGEAYGKQ